MKDEKGASKRKISAFNVVRSALVSAKVAIQSCMAAREVYCCHSHFYGISTLEWHIKAPLHCCSFSSSTDQIPKHCWSKSLAQSSMCGVFPPLCPKIFKIIIPAAMAVHSWKRRTMGACCSAEDVEQYLEYLPEKVHVWKRYDVSRCLRRFWNKKCTCRYLMVCSSVLCINTSLLRALSRLFNNSLAFQ